MLTDAFLIWLASASCFMAALERPDRQMFWLSCLYFCGAMLIAMGVLSA